MLTCKKIALVLLLIFISENNRAYGFHVYSNDLVYQGIIYWIPTTVIHGVSTNWVLHLNEENVNFVFYVNFSSDYSSVNFAYQPASYSINQSLNVGDLLCNTACTCNICESNPIVIE